MIPRNQRNRKVQIDLRCPTCGMVLTAKSASGYTKNGDTFCCQGCAEGTGCTCPEPVGDLWVKDSPKGAIQQREPGQLPAVGRADHAAELERQRMSNEKNLPDAYPTRKAGAHKPAKRKKSRTKERDSSREQARGRSEFTGQLNKGGATRVSRTGTKSNPKH